MLRRSPAFGGRGAVALLVFSKNFDKISSKNAANFSFKVGSREVYNYSTKIQAGSPHHSTDGELNNSSNRGGSIFYRILF